MDAHDQIKQYVDVAWRRKWWFVVPALIGLGVAFYLARTLPKVYQASTTILAIRQAVPQDIAPSTASGQPEERIKSLKIQVFSRQYLEKVAREYGLVKPDDSEAAIERACRRLANEQVDIEWDRQSLSWFKIIVDDSDPKRAAGIANSLAKLFIDQNNALRRQAAQGLEDTVATWRKEKQAELKARDEKITKFREDHLYELPDQQGVTSQLLNASQTRIAQLTSDIESRTQRLAALREEEAAKRAAAASGVGIPITGDPDAVSLAQMERDLHDLLIDYTEENPAVKKKREQIEQFKSLHPGIADERSSPSAADSISSPEILRVRGEIETLTADRAREQKHSEELQKRLENMPKIQQQLTDLTRDYDTLKQQYETAVGQEDQAKRAKDIVDAKKGEQFEIQDLARPPAVPFKPQVLRLLVMGLLAGLGLGAGMAVVLEFLDHTVKNEDDFAALYPDVPVLGAIPNLDRDSGRRKARQHSEIHSAAGMVLFALTASTLGSILGGLLG